MSLIFHLRVNMFTSMWCKHQAAWQCHDFPIWKVTHLLVQFKLVAHLEPFLAFTADPSIAIVKQNFSIISIIVHIFVMIIACLLTVHISNACIKNTNQFSECAKCCLCQLFCHPELNSSYLSTMTKLRFIEQKLNVPDNKIATLYVVSSKKEH